MARPFLKLSSNEIDAIAKEEERKWRIFRLQQVRQQSRNESARIIRDTKKEEINQKEKIKVGLKKKWEEDTEKNIKILEEKYLSSLAKFGEAHKKAEDEQDLIEAKERKMKENRDLAIKRSSEAFKKKIEQDAVLIHKRREDEVHKKRTFTKERRRAQRVASLPTPPRLKAIKKAPTFKPKKVQFYEAGTFTTTSFVPKSDLVNKEKKASEGPAAREFAHQEMEREEQIRMNLSKKKEMEEMKRRERGEAAQKKESIHQLHSRLLDGLSLAERQHRLSTCLEGSETDLEDSIVTNREELIKIAEMKAEKILKELMEHSESHIKQKCSDLQDMSLSSSSSPSEAYLTSPASESSSNFQTQFILKEGSAILNGETKPTCVEGSHPIQIEPTHPDEILILPSHPNSFKTSPLKLTQHGPVKVHPSQPINTKDIHLKETVPADMAPTLHERLVATSKSSPQNELDSSDEITEEKKLSGESTIKHPQKPLVSEEFKEKNTENEHLTTEPEVKDITLQEIWDNLQKLRSGSMKIAKLIEKQKWSSYNVLSSKSESKGTLTSIDPKIQTPQSKNSESDSTPQISSCSSTSFLTPIRHYTEEIKGDGTGKRLLNKREKFEARKKELMQHYAQKLLHMKKEDLDAVSASTVEGSGLDVCTILTPTSFESTEKSSVDSSLKELTVEDASSRTSRGSDPSSKYEDLDTYPSKLSSVTSESGEESSSHPSGENAILLPQEDPRKTLLRVLQRYKHVQELKQMLLLEMNTDFSDGRVIQREETPVRMESADESSVYPSSSTSDLEDEQVLLQSILSALSKSGSSSSLPADSKDSGLKLSLASASGSSSNRSSTTPSIPDMIDVLKKFNR